MKFGASKWFGLVFAAAVATSAFAGTSKPVMVPSPHGSGYTAVSGTGACADVTFSGEKGTSSFHLESINSRPCGANEQAGSRTYTQTNPSGPGAGGGRGLAK